MTDIEQLIRLNVELEGLLKVLQDRDNLHARSILAEKFEEYSRGVKTLLAQAEGVAQEANAVEVKDQEAVENEVKPEAQQAEESIAKEVAFMPEEEVHFMHDDDEPVEFDHSEVYKPEHKTNEKLLKAFTLNDRFRFCRELFEGNDDDFNATLYLLADMDSYSEAEDYLLNDMMWKRNNPAVADYLAVLKQNMPR